MNQPAIVEADLQAYVDNRLPADRRADVEAFLREHPDVSERVRAYVEQKAAIQALHHEELDEAIPERLLRAAIGQGAPPRHALRMSMISSRGPAWQIAAGLVIAIAGAAAGWGGRSQLTADRAALHRPQSTGIKEGESLPRWAAMAHQVYSSDAKRPVELGAQEKPQLVKWLSHRLQTTIQPPSLSAFGYHLLGGRLLSGPQGPVAQFMYQDTTGQRLTLYVSSEHTAGPKEGFRFAREGPVNVYYWYYDKFGYALSADIDQARLERLATSACKQLEAS